MVSWCAPSSGDEEVRRDTDPARHGVAAMTPRTRSLLLLHGVVVIFGFTGILGKLITVAAEPLVFWRVAITANNKIHIQSDPDMVQSSGPT